MSSIKGFILTASVLLVLVSVCLSAPPYITSDKLEMRDDLIEGDIVPNPESKNGIRGDRYRWANRTVPYQLDSNFNSSEVEKILLGWAEIENTTCIDLRERQSQDSDYIFIEKGRAESGCFSSVGRVGGRQVINFEPPCINRHGTIVHEMLHAIGFYHEQSRPDRDDYVTVVWEKIEPGKEHNFNKYTEEQVDTMGTPYDYGSVLHYSGFGFSIDGSATIVPKDPNAEIGQRIRISDIDAYKVNVMYNCTSFL
ncbi:Zinc metalloproteinase nas-13 [Orchesella cincta]|uniref:Metalloendopeptidase n=1 Tax=Orchesella cincta TaxID=48709 RepID=A0A1D2NI54_ORCCI|nr:Zinc metalloproteinase nas-13 [Orchesella cincta]